MNVNARFLAVVGLLVGLAATSTSTLSAAPSSGTSGTVLVAPQLYWGAIIDGSAYGFGSVPGDMRGVATFESHLGKPVSILALGNYWQGGGAMKPFRAAEMDNIRAHGSVPMYTWLSNGDKASDFQNAIITGRRYDAYIHQWARDARAWGHPFFLRFDAEMNGWWHPWGEGQVSPGGPIVNGNHAGDFVAMYHHVFNIFAAESATDVTWVWAVNHESTDSQYPPMQEIYPGDAFVHWTGIDPYNRYNGAWLSFNQMLTGEGTSWMSNTYQAVQNVAPTKPMMLAEFGSVEASAAMGPRAASVSPAHASSLGVAPMRPPPALPAPLVGHGLGATARAATGTTVAPGDAKPAWLRDAFLEQLPFNFPALKAIVYFNWGLDNPSVPLESSAASLAAASNALVSPYYAANTFGLLPAGPIQPLVEQTLFLAPVADTYFAQDAPSSTFGGSAPFLYIQGVQGAARTAYMRFDLASLRGRTIDQTVLQLTTTTDSWAGSSGTINVHFNANNGLGEPYASWSNQGGPWDVAPDPLSSIVAPALTGTKYIFGVPPSLVTSHSGSLLSFTVDASAGADNFVILAREASDPSVRPQLIVAFH